MKNDKIIFTRKISRSGQAKVLLITIPMSIRNLVEFDKEYKVTLEELKAAL